MGLAEIETMSDPIEGIEELIDLGGTGGNGLLDDVFSGEEGVATTLLRDFGGSATIVFPGDLGEYDRQTDSYPDKKPDSVYTVPFSKETGTFASGRVAGAVRERVGGTLIQSGDVVGMIPYDSITGTIIAGKCRLVTGKACYVIVATEDVSSGNENAAIIILGSNR